MLSILSIFSCIALHTDIFKALNQSVKHNINILSHTDILKALNQGLKHNIYIYSISNNVSELVFSSKTANLIVFNIFL